MDAPAKTTYTVIQLGGITANAIGASINGKGQVAFNVDEAGLTRTKFYDGKAYAISERLVVRVLQRRT